MNRRNRITQKSWKDYIIPIIGVLLVFLLIISFLGSKSGNDNTNTDLPTDKLEITVGEDVEAYVILAGGEKPQIENSAQIFPGERLYVKSGTLESFSPNFKLGQFGELRYDAKNTYALFSSNLWLDPSEDTTVEMRFASVQIPAGAIVSLSQNDAASTIYVFKGEVIVKNVDGTKELTLNKGQKISILLNEANKEDLDLLSKVESIPDYILEEDWFVKNNAKAIMDLIDDEDVDGEESGDDTNPDVETNISSYIKFDIEDGASIDKDEIIIEGELLNNNISKITLNGQEATLDKDQNIFKIESFKLNGGNNDIIYKVYSEDDIIVSKGVISVFNTMTDSGTFDSVEVTAYPINPEYGFYVANPLTTTASFVTIRGFVPAGKIDHIKVNGYQLRQYIAGTTDWRYHADSTYNLLKDGINLYTVEYFDENNTKITESLFIIKKVAAVETPVETTSDESN